MAHEHHIIDGTKSSSINLSSASYADLFGDTVAPAAISKEVAAACVSYAYRAVDLRASAVSTMPWAITPDAADEPIATNDDYASMKWLAQLTDLLYLTESALSILGMAYWWKASGKGSRRSQVVDLQWFAPSTMTPYYSTQTGDLQNFKRASNGKVYTIPVDDIAYFKLLNYNSETEPGQSPVGAALADAGVVFNLNEFSAQFFSRGAIRATMLTVEGNPTPTEKDRLKSWWYRAFSGIGKAFGSEVFASSVKPVMIGDGLDGLSNADLTNEKREAIATAMGVPHSLVISNSANYATAQADQQNFYATTITPESNRIASTMNRCIFAPMGLKFKFNPESLPIYQEAEEERAASYAAYVATGMLPSIAAEMLGLQLPEGVDYTDLDPDEEPEPEPTPEPEEEPQPDGVADAQADAENAQKRAEASQFRKWCKRRYRPDLTKFSANYLSFDEKKAIAAEVTDVPSVEDGAADDAPFPVVEWDAYP